MVLDAISPQLTTGSRPTRVIIVGAGVAGCILARRLAQVPNMSVTLLERVSEGDHSEAGTGLNIGPNAVKALRSTDLELANRVESASLPWKRLSKWTTAGEKLNELDLNDVSDCDGWRIRWSDLYIVLRDACRDTVRYGCTEISIKQHELRPSKSKVQWVDDKGAHVLDNVDLLVGTDGRYSNIRRYFAGEPEVRQLGVAVFRLLLPNDSAMDFDDHEQWFNGPNRLLAFRVRPDQTYVAGTVPLDTACELTSELRSASTLRKLYTPSSGSPCQKAGWLIDHICENAEQAHWARMQEHDIRFCETSPAVLYLGDAAHAMVPTLGQGATQAIEDACFASDWITSEIRMGRVDPMAWLLGIEAGRLARVKYVMEFSKSASNSLLLGGDPLAGAREELSEAYMQRLRRLYRELPSIKDVQDMMVRPSRVEAPL